MTPKTRPAPQPDTTTKGDDPGVPALAPDVEQPSVEQGRSLRLVVWAVLALVAGVAIVVLLSRTGVESEVTSGTTSTDTPAVDVEAGRQQFLDDLRSVGRVDPVDPVAGRELYFEDLRSIGRVDPVAGQEQFFDDLRSIGRIDPVAGREVYFEDLRSIGRTTP